MSKFAKFAFRVLGIVAIGTGAACSYEGYQLLGAIDNIDKEEAQEKVRAKRAKECIHIVDPDDLDL